MNDDVTEIPGWPFDAYEDDPLTALRIPVVPHPWPGWKYEVCLVCPADERGQELYPALRPDDAEVRQIVAYIRHRMAWYNPGWQAHMRKRPLDVDSGTNTVILWKRADGTWCYRRATWQYGPTMMPPYDKPGLTLEALLDRIVTHDGLTKGLPDWAEWKAAHPEAWPAPAAISDGGGVQ